MSEPYVYAVWGPDGKLKMYTEFPECRYPRSVELSIMANGYTITLNGKKLTRRATAERSD